jgi:hypothetical protein
MSAMGRDEAKKLGIASCIELIPKELSSFDMYIAFSKKSKCYNSLKNGFAARIKAYTGQGKVKKLPDGAEKKGNAVK